MYNFKFHYLLKNIEMKGEINILKQVNNGFKEYYYLKDNGDLFNNNTQRYLKLDKCNYGLMTNDNKYKRISLKNLYKLVYNKNFCYDTIKDLENEIWREIPDTDGQYLISNKGRIKSLKGYYAILIQQWKNESNYYKVTIFQNNIKRNKFVHVLVALAFTELCGTPQDITSQVHHKNGITTDNRAENLQWLTEKEHLQIHK